MKPSVITISRQYGSGGRNIGEHLSQKLGIPIYEKTLFDEASKDSGIHRNHFERAEANKGRYFSETFYSTVTPFNMPLDDRIFLAQAKTIRELAARGSCIIVGRGGNRILQDRNDVLNIFCYAQKEMRLNRITQVYGVPAELAEKRLKEVDKQRASYLNFYTNQTFGKAENYHLCIDSGAIGIENAVKIIEKIFLTVEL